MRTLILLLLGLSFGPLSMAADIEGTHIKGYNFGYGSIEKGCTAHRESGSTISIICKDKKLKPVSRSCEGYMNGGLESVTLNCSGGLWALGQRCKIEMRGANFGEINCRL